MQLKDPFDTKLCTLNVVVLSAVAVLASCLIARKL